jgi:putative ABC transport system permease protein
MKTPLAWLNLWHDKARAAVALAGVAFAVVLILMQLGFYLSVRQTATRIYDRLDFDLLLMSPQYLHLSKPGTFPMERLTQALSAPGVRSGNRFYLGFNMWLNPENKQRRGIMVMAFDPDDSILRLEDVERQRHELRRRDTALMDDQSRPEFGHLFTGLVTDVGRRKIEVAGMFTLGTGFGADGDILVSDQTYAHLFPGYPLSQINLGLLHIEKDADPDEVADSLRKLLPSDVKVLTRAEISSEERHHWIMKTSVGIIFGLGVIVALLVGTAIVYQVLASDIANHLPEYATLKAIGYGRGYLTWIILQQALILAVVGFVPGLALAAVLFRLTTYMAHLSMDLSFPLGAVVLVLSVLMCSISGMASLRKVHGADPADLFR